MAGKENVNVSNENFLELFSGAIHPIGIDSYQRPYVWGEKKIRQLIEDLEDFDQNTCADDERQYYMGTILLHEKDAEKRLFVIDGQQRLTSLCVLHYVLNKKMPNNCALTFQNPESWKNIVQAQKIFDQKRTDIDPNLLQKICFTVITVDSEDLAFTFFDTQNNRGVPLATTDLMKAYHLRAIGGADDSGMKIQEDAAKRWENLQKIKPVIGTGSDFAPILFHYFLWRARCWKGWGFKINPSRDDILEEFQPKKSERDSRPDAMRLYASRKNCRARELTLIPGEGYRLSSEDIHLSNNPTELPIAIRQPIDEGISFFLYSEKYAELLRQMTDKESDDIEVRAFKQFYDDVISSLSNYIQELFLLACLIYVDQFGYHRLLEFALWLDYVMGGIRMSKKRIVEQAPAKFLQENGVNLLDIISSAFRSRDVIEYLKGSRSQTDQIYKDYEGEIVNGTIRDRYREAVLNYYCKKDSREELKDRYEWICKGIFDQKYKKAGQS